ncbi:MAG: PilN domain-containing protein [bacterium]
MATINLLPWREQYREEKRKEFFALLALTAIVAFVLLFVWDRYVNSRIEWQQSRNEYLQQEITKLDKQVAEIRELKKRRQEMIDRMQVIQNLQSNRPETVKLFDELVKAVPDGLFLSNLNRKGTVVSLKGYSESNNRVSSLMRQLDASVKYSDSNLTKVNADDVLGEDGSTFEMNVRIKPEPGAENPDTQGGATGG